MWDQNHLCVSEHLSELLRHIHVCPDVCYAVLLEKKAPFILDELETTCVHPNKPDIFVAIFVLENQHNSCRSKTTCVHLNISLNSS